MQCAFHPYLIERYRLPSMLINSLSCMMTCTAFRMRLFGKTKKTILKIGEILVRDGWKQVTDMTGARHMNKIAEATQELMAILANHGEETGNSTTTTTTGGGQVREHTLD